MLVKSHGAFQNSLQTAKRQIHEGGVYTYIYIYICIYIYIYILGTYFIYCMSIKAISGYLFRLLRFNSLRRLLNLECGGLSPVLTLALPIE